MSPPRIDLTGKRFGNIRVVKIAKRSNHGWYWTVTCRCGKRWDASGNHVRSGLKGCRSCSNPKYKIVSPELVRKYRAEGKTWETIAKRFGVSRRNLDTKLKKLKGRTSDGVRNGRAGLRVRYARIAALRDLNVHWRTIAMIVKYQGNYNDLQSVALHWSGVEMRRSLNAWMESTHGRVVKACREGFASESEAAVRANVSGSAWNQLKAKPLPTNVLQMLSLDLPKIANWLVRGTPWRDIREFLPIACRSAKEAREIYEARLRWDASLTKHRGE